MRLFLKLRKPDVKRSHSDGMNTPPPRQLSQDVLNFWNRCLWQPVYDLVIGRPTTWTFCK
jgi:hypothetical protein